MEGRLIYLPFKMTVVFDSDTMFSAFKFGITSKSIMEVINAVDL